MSKLCIVFDRLRAEEKMLQKEASELGHDAVMLDADVVTVWGCRLECRCNDAKCVVLM